MPAVKYGVIIPYGSARQAAELAHVAEENGWDGVFVGDAIWTEDPLIRLTAAAMTTQRIKLGTMVIPAPLRSPWTLAGQCLALDNLSEGRLILGLATGATWMGWDWFPNVPMDIHTRAGMLDEMIDILTLLFQRKQFDYAGTHYQVKLSASDLRHFPPASCQQPRVPIWIPGVCRRAKSLRRVLKCDGCMPMCMDAEGKFVEVTPPDLAEMRDIIHIERSLDTPYDLVIEGRTGDLPPEQAQAKLSAWAASGMTWWIESTWEDTPDKLSARIRQGPPHFE